jgi:hypothetical protein
MVANKRILVLNEKIISLKDKLNTSIINCDNYDYIYKLSTKLDELIVLYYKEINSVV